jgi:uncharacterized protein
MSLIVSIKVVPQSGKQEMAVDKSGTLKCYLKSAPEKGRANKELVRFFADSLKIPQAAIMIIAGDQVRTKKIKIDSALTLEQFLNCFGLQKDHQMGLFKKE